MNQNFKPPSGPVAGESARSSGAQGRTRPEELLATARREQEAAALDVYDAAQAAAQAAAMADRGSREESSQLARLASQLYERAGGRRQRARRLAAQARLGEQHDG